MTDISLDDLAAGPLIGIARDSSILVDDRVVVTVPSGWSNVSSSASGRTRTYCLAKTSVESAVSRTYGGVAGYQKGRPYRMTWWEKTTGSWSAQTDVARFLYYGDGDLVLVKKTWDITADPLYIEDFRAYEMTANEYAGESDRLTALAFGSVDAAAYPDQSHLALLPRTMDALVSGGTLRILLLGDSFMNGLSSTPWEALLMRKYPRCNVVPLGAFIGSTGMDWPLVDGYYGWDNPTRIDGVVAYAPHLVIVGGISSTYGLTPEQMPVADSKAHWASVISRLRAGLPNVEIVVGSKANGHDSTSAYVQEIAETNDVAFWDESTAINTLCTRAGTTTSALIDPSGGGDGTHFGWQGLSGLCRCFGAFFGACGT